MESPNGDHKRTHTTEEGTEKVCDLDTFVQLLKESPALLSLGRFCEEKTFIRMNGIPTTRPKLWMIGSRHELWATMSSNTWIQNCQNGFNHPRKDPQGDLQVRKTTLQLTWPYHRQQVFRPRIIHKTCFRTQQEESTVNSLNFRKTLFAKYADARKLRERHAEEILTIGRTELNLPQYLVI